MAGGSFLSSLPESNVIFDSSAGHDHDGSNSKLAVGVVPIGAVIAWLKTLTNTPSLPAQFVECNGQTLSDAGSVYNGQVIPDLNGSSGTERFLRGQTTSGGTSGSEVHRHSSADNADGNSRSFWGTGENTRSTADVSTLPTYYEVVWIIRIK
ncbi:hypothetical protein LCGC14_3148850 [marine sediment metagenome]|uniref:Phage tail collar domain-containing protein n=1 Tax=marine sediment metagenome TaxID=412755 RepID=A0A0F8YIZ9_9ZZZZ